MKWFIFFIVMVAILILILTVEPFTYILQILGVAYIVGGLRDILWPGKSK